jgi:hypothetical protein
MLGCFSVGTFIEMLREKSFEQWSKDKGKEPKDQRHALISRKQVQSTNV